MATRAAKAPARKPAAKKKPVVKKKVGRPTKFDPKYVKQVYQLALLGLTDAEMAPVLGVSLATLKNWKAAHPEFLAANARGKTLADAEVAASLRERAIGYSHPEVVITQYQGEITRTRVTKHYPPDTHAAGIWLRNRQPGRWKLHPDPTDGNDDAPPPVKVVVQVKDARTRADDAEPERPAG